MQVLTNNSQISQEKMVTPQKHSLRLTNQPRKKKFAPWMCLLTTHKLVHFELCKWSHVRHFVLIHKMNKEK